MGTEWTYRRKWEQYRLSRRFGQFRKGRNLFLNFRSDHLTSLLKLCLIVTGFVSEDRAHRADRLSIAIVQLQLDLETLAANVDLQNGLAGFDHFKIIPLTFLADAPDAGREKYVVRAVRWRDVQGENLQFGMAGHCSSTSLCEYEFVGVSE